MNINFNRKRRDPEVDRQMKVNYAPGKRLLNKLKWRLTLLIILSPFIYFAGKLLFSLLLSPASGFVIIGSQAYQSPVDSIVAELNVNVGQKIKINDTLAILSDPALEEMISKSQKDFDNLTKEMGTAQEVKIKYYKKQMALAQSFVNYNIENYKNIKYLFENQAATINEKKTALVQLNSAKSALYGLQLNVDTLKYEITNNQKDLSIKPDYIALNDKLERLKKAKKELVIKAKSDGIVTEASVKVGDVLFRGDIIVRLSQPELQTIIAYVKPSHIDLVNDGQLADVKFPSGIIIKARIKSDVATTGRLPEYLTTPMLGRQRMLLVHLIPLGDIPEDEKIDGLPVTISFMTKMQSLIDKF
ncbi:MAG: HlyD family efflux transporter periplasmic adaptor subunit [Desulfotalea sp.]